MTSEERVLEFFDVFPAELPELRKAFKCHLDQHAAELSNRVRRHLERVDERECSLKAWNAICDALLELHDDKNIKN